MNIHPFSECASEYAKRLHKCSSLPQLDELLNEFAPLVQDAISKKPKTEMEFAEFREGLLHENRGEFAGYEFMKRYDALMMPEVMFVTSIFMFEFKVPWGAMFMRLQEVGRIVQDSEGNYSVKK